MNLPSGNCSFLIVKNASTTGLYFCEFTANITQPTFSLIAATPIITTPSWISNSTGGLTVTVPNYTINNLAFNPLLYSPGVTNATSLPTIPNLFASASNIFGIAIIRSNSACSACFYYTGIQSFVFVSQYILIFGTKTTSFNTTIIPTPQITPSTLTQSYPLFGPTGTVNFPTAQIMNINLLSGNQWVFMQPPPIGTFIPLFQVMPNNSGLFVVVSGGNSINVFYFDSVLGITQIAVGNWGGVTTTFSISNNYYGVAITPSLNAQTNTPYPPSGFCYGIIYFN